MLEEYRQKRDFTRTPEPRSASRDAARGRLIFVVHKHQARRQHYDLRLELDGVLKSWAVPKGPSLNPGHRQLAVMVEDHPLDYASFEGVIPAGEYGAGQVIVWDNGDYTPVKDGKAYFDDRNEAQRIMRTALAEGKVTISMRGHKLKGSFALAHMRGENWLLIKRHDEHATEEDILKREESVLSGLPVEQVGREAESAPGDQPDPARLPGARRASMPTSMVPMLASLADRPFSSPEWLFEPKMDGVRVLVFIKGGSARLISRNENDMSHQYPTLVRQLESLPIKDAILDGETVALDERGVPSFQALQSRLNLGKSEDVATADRTTPVKLFIFDIIYYNGYDLRQVELRQRKGLLARVLTPTAQVKLLDYFEGSGELVYEQAAQHGFEGVVAKRADSYYEAGNRSRKWLKIKHVLTDDFIVGGYTRGRGRRLKSFGSLLLGFRDASGKLIYSGNVGTGFDEALEATVLEHLKQVQADQNPFDRVPRFPEPVTWVKPVLVAEVKFTERTRDGRLRAPVFLRFRPDKPADQVRPSQVLERWETPKKEPVEEGTVSGVVQQLENGPNNFDLAVEGSTVSLTNLDKVFWPEFEGRRALTKRDLLIYAAKVSPYLLPHLRHRPLTLSRYPHGINGAQFFQKNWSAPLPGFVERVPVRRHHTGGVIEYVMCNNLATLLWLGQVADIEYHASYSRLDPDPDVGPGAAAQMDDLTQYPDFLVLDIDPYIYSGAEARGAEPELNRAAFARTCEAALWLKQKLDSIHLSAFVKTSGKTGVHIYVPIVREYTYDAVRSMAATLCQYVLREHADMITMDWAVEKRTGKVFLDSNQNARGKTLASPYSPRPVPAASVSTPLNWEELANTYPTDHTILTVPERLGKLGDVWADILKKKNDINALLKSAG